MGFFGTFLQKLTSLTFILTLKNLFTAFAGLFLALSTKAY
jgi:hypothetical protein